MEQIIQSIQLLQVVFMLYLFYAVVEVKSSKYEVFMFWILLSLFMGLKLWVIASMTNSEVWSNLMELLWGVYNVWVYIYFFIYLRNNFRKKQILHK